MKLREKQSLFCKKVALLILYAYEKGYEITFGDAWAKDGHSENSLHYDRLAIDLNLFKNGRYLTETEDHKELGDFWVGLHPWCRWGGSNGRNDGNHYSFTEDFGQW